MSRPLRHPQRLEARVDAKGRVTLPKALRQRLGILPGQALLFRVEGEEIRAVTPRGLIRQMQAARRRVARTTGEDAR
jgi:AbrB family looped-hinge helix DNA binding protein